MTRFALAAVTAAIALGVAACGGSSSSSSSAAAAPSSSSAAAAPSGGTGSGSVAVAADPSGQLKFSTDALSAQAGTVHISFTNTSSVGHNFTLVRSGGGGQIGATPTFSGGTKTLTVKLTPGIYTYYCSVPGHRMAGMQGTLTVK